MNKVLEQIEENIAKDLLDLGFEIEYTEYVKENDNNILRIVIDSVEKKEVDMDSCEKVSRKIEDKVDKLMKNATYILEVSSPGLERQIKNIKLYKKYIGEKVVVKLFKKQEIKDGLMLKEFEATIIEVDEEASNVTFKIDEAKKIFSIKEIASCHIYVDFEKIFKENNI